MGSAGAAGHEEVDRTAGGWVMKRAARAIAAIVLLAIGATGILGAPTLAQSPQASGPLCVLTLDELGEATGLTFQTMSGTDTSCEYASTATDSYLSVSVRVEEGDLDLIKDFFSEGGEDVTVAGMPGWNSDIALWVDIGPRLLAVQAVFFGTDVPENKPTQLAIAELVIPRLPAEVLEPSPAPSVGPMPSLNADPELAARFPTEIAGETVTPFTVSGQQLVDSVDTSDPEAAAALEAFQEELAARGKTIDDLSFGTAFVMDTESGASVSLNALRIRDADMASFRDALVPIFASEFEDLQTEEIELGGKTVVKASDGSDPEAEPRYFYVAGDVLWLVNGDEPLLTEAFQKLP
jgi:hypothetical protein